jgi:ABC-2 type transport system permease protein
MSWRMLRAQVLVEQRIFWRNLSTMFFTFVLPIVLLVLVVFGGGGDDMLAMIVALGIISTGFQGLSMQLAMHRDQGVLKGIMATPMSPATFIAAKVASVLVVVAIETLVVVVVGASFTDAPLPDHPVELVVLLVVGTATFAAIGFAVASVIPSADAAPAIVNAAYLGMVLVAAVLARMDDLPAVVQSIGDALPLGSLVTSIHDAWVGGGDGVVVPALVMLAWCAAAAAWTVRRFRWEPREALH